MPSIPERFLAELLPKYGVSEAELRAIALAIEGQSATAIAKTLGISEVAVRKRLGEVYRKFSIAGSGPGKLAEFKRILELQYQASQENISQRFQDLGDAPDVSMFYGRTAELALLQDWIVGDKCRLITVFGVGGIGKTSLAVKLTTQAAIEREFKFIVWRSLKDAPSLQELLSSFLSSFPKSLKTDAVLGESASRITKLLEQLRKHRCLLILDNVESLFQEGRSGVYRTGYETYGELFRRIGEGSHQSCLILTSREKPKEIAALEGETLPVRSYQLLGLEQVDAEEIIRAKGVSSSQVERQALMERYERNPLALKIVTTTIKELFRGSIAAFLKQNIPVFVGDIRDLLLQQFERLSQPEIDILYWLAIERQPVSLQDLQMDIVSPDLKLQLMEDLESLNRRSLIAIDERSEVTKFTLHPVIMEYVTYRFIEQIHQEILSKEIDVFESHVLVKAQSDVEMTVKDAQISRILEPLGDRLMATLGSKEQVKNVLLGIVSIELKKSSLATGYAAANILRLLHHLQISLEGCNFSNLNICQADLERVALHNVDFSHSTFTRCSFTDILDSILCVTCSPDGSWLAAGDCDGTIHLWQATNGKKLLTWRAHGNWVRCLAFSLERQILASCSDDHTIRLWNVHTGEPLDAAPLEGHTNWVWSIAFSPDGNYLASASSDCTVRLWRVKDGKSLHVFKGHQDFVRTVAFNPDGRTLASGSADGSIRLWDIQKRECRQVLEGHHGRIWTVAFSPDGQILGSGGDDSTIQLWDIHKGMCFAVWQGHTDVIRAIAFSSTGSYLASCSDDTTVRLWDLCTQQCIQILEGHDSRVWSVGFKADGQILASGSDDKTVRLWSISTFRCIRVLQGYTNTIWSLAYSPDGKTLASGSDDKVIRLWDAQTGDCQVLGEHEGRIWSVAFSPDGKLLATGGDDRMVRLWNLQTGKFQTLKRWDAWVRAVAFSPDGSQLAIGSDDRQVQRWDIQQEKWLPLLKGHDNTVRSVVYSRDGQILISGSDDETIRIWHLPGGEASVIKQPQSLGKNRVWAIALHPNSQLVAVGGDDSVLRLWHVHTQQMEREFDEGDGYIRAIAFSPDGRLLASGGTNNTISLWEIATGRCSQKLHGHTNWVRSIVFSPDGQTLASASQDWTICLWDVEAGKCRQVLRTPRIYEGMVIMGTTGLSPAQQQMLKRLGAIA